jgi:hypothetical protein
METLNEKLKVLLEEVQSSDEVPYIIKDDALNDLDYLINDEFDEYDLEDIIDFYEEVLDKAYNQ